jgi:hypothetical protein
MDPSVATIALDAMPVLLLALSVVLLPFTREPPTGEAPARVPGRKRRS